jgi:rod shape-determining protein MreC
MNRKKGPNRFIYLVAVILLLIGLFFTWKKTRFNFITTFAGGIQKKISGFVFSTGEAIGSIKNNSAVKKDMKTETEKNMQLDAENQVLKAENEKLKKAVMLKSGRDFKSSIICYASVIGSNDDGFIYFYVIDRGAEDGISEGDGVITYEGAVGRIYKVTGSTATVQLLTDVKSAVSARDSRSRVTGILAGVSYDQCSVNYIPKEEDINVGDTMVTSGLGKSFPEGVKIGTVTEVNKKVDSLAMVVRVKPAVNMMVVEEVLVVRKRN